MNPICHVCKKEKKPYIVVMDDSIFSFMKYEHAREGGDICERCDQYFGMTGEFIEPTEEEFENAKLSVKFAITMHDWWFKDRKIMVIDDKENPPLIDIEATKIENSRNWEGTETIAKWYREKLNKNNGGFQK